MQAVPHSAARPRRWRNHRRALLALRRHLVQRHLAELRAFFAQEEAAPAPGAVTDFAARLLAGEEDARREITDALERIERGTYGICEVTGLPIPAARLRAVPWLRRIDEAETGRRPAASAGLATIRAFL